MQSRFAFIFIVFSLVGILIFTLHVRSETARSFYKLRIAQVRQGRLRQDLWQKQLQFESLVNPEAISEYSQTRDETEKE
jgi:hypothetical protein